jgi:hypothetical protein
MTIDDCCPLVVYADPDVLEKGIHAILSFY